MSEQSSSILSKRVSAVSESATLVINAKANALKKSGVDVVNLSVGEPDFDTPDHVCAAGIKAIDDRQTRYTAVHGIEPLRQAIADKLSRDNRLTYDPQNEIIVSVGAKQALFNAVMALVNPGDEVIIPAPYWVSYVEIVTLAEGKSVIVSTEQSHGFKLQAQDIEKAITPKTKMLFLNSPSNPTGAVYSKEELLVIAEVLRRHPQVIVVSDDIYEPIVFQGRSFAHFLNVAPDLRDRCVVVNGVSKSFAMTGWRIGYAAGPKVIISAIKVLQSQSTSNPCSIAQNAALAAISGPDDFHKQMTQEFEKRAQYMYEELSQISGFNIAPIEGAFYVFVNAQKAIEDAFQKGLISQADDLSFVTYLLEKAHVAAVPGSVFGAPGCFRLSFAVSMAQLEKAVSRIRNLLL